MGFKKNKALIISVFLTVVIIAAVLVLSSIFGGEAWHYYSTPRVDATEKFPKPQEKIDDIQTNGVGLSFRTGENYFYLKSNNEWLCKYIKGVNMGLTLPNTDLNSPDIDYETYIRWFSMISDMNANTIRVFSIMNPDFYNAFYDYNLKNPNSPLYLIQGIWFNEGYLEDPGDAFGNDGIIVESFKRSVKETVDIIHGKCDYTSYGNIEKAVYDKDISPYVTGYILGLEWPSGFVEKTNENYKRIQFSGEYLYTNKAEAFEIFLAEIGESLIAYETESYNFQTPIAFLNWQTTDTLEHPEEPFPEEDSAAVNTSAILSTEKYYAKMFAAVDVYPYYPEFMNYQSNYLTFYDNEKKKNPYRAYLRELKSEYNMPVIIAETGLPTSRGIAHKSVMGYDQGGITEEQQGEYVSDMVSQIARENYAGSLIFSWQDEWFKQTWNTVRYYSDNPLIRTKNTQSAEQSYGILAFEPGSHESIIYPDGDTTDWQGKESLISNDIADIYASHDEIYFYLNIKLKEDKIDKNKLLIPLSFTGNGNTSSKEYRLEFEKNADFLLVIDGKKKTRLLVNSNYDTYYYNYSVAKNVFDKNYSYQKKNNGIFNNINQFISNEIAIPDTKIKVAPQYYESGLLNFGNANPASKDYSSLSDFYYSGKTLEVRIPWALLNVVNSNSKTIISDLYENNGVSFTTAENLFIGFNIYSGEKDFVEMTEYNWQTKDRTMYFERLKKSYNIISKTYKSLMEKY